MGHPHNQAALKCNCLLNYLFFSLSEPILIDCLIHVCDLTPCISCFPSYDPKTKCTSVDFDLHALNIYVWF
jgi:hypothetical protein